MWLCIYLLTDFLSTLFYPLSPTSALLFPPLPLTPPIIQLGLICSLSGSLCLAASYPFSELVFRIGGRLEGGAVSEEAACTVGSFANTAIFSLWTAAYTAPRWKEEVTSYTKPGQSVRRTVSQTDRQTDRETDRLTYRQTANQRINIRLY